MNPKPLLKYGPQKPAPRALFTVSRRALLVPLILILLLSMPAFGQAGPESSVHRPGLEFSLGQIGIAEDLSEPLLLGVEYFSRPLSRWKLRPGLGFTWSASDVNYLYATIRRDFYLGKRWLLTPGVGIGLFNDSRQLDLGHDVQFRSSLALGYRFTRGYRLGVSIFHLSNGGISDANPGTEAAIIFFSLPL